MIEIELNSEGIDKQDNNINVEMTDDEIWFIKHFIKKYHPKKIVEIGISAGGNTVNILNWKDDDAKLFSIDISKYWYRDKSKLSGFMADELDVNDNWKIYRGYDYLDVYTEIGNDIDLIIIDTVHSMPGEFLTFLAALPQLKDGCIVILHDIHLNMVKFYKNCFSNYCVDAYCTGLLFGGVGSTKKWTVKSDTISNIGAFIVDEYTKEHIKDVFHILCSTWHYFPNELNLSEYLNYFNKNYSAECYNLFNNCLSLQSKYFNVQKNQNAKSARVDIINSNNKNNLVQIINAPEFVDVDYPNWFKRDNGEGAVLHTKVNSFDIKLKCINDGVLNILLRGPDIRNDDGKRIPYYIKFNDFSVNGNRIIKDAVTCWHDNSFIFETNVLDGDIFNLHFEWEVL